MQTIPVYRDNLKMDMNQANTIEIGKTSFGKIYDLVLINHMKLLILHLPCHNKRYFCNFFEKLC
jgi:hypothetical protein